RVKDLGQCWESRRGLFGSKTAGGRERTVPQAVRDARLQQLKEALQQGGNTPLQQAKEQRPAAPAPTPSGFGPPRQAMPIEEEERSEERRVGEGGRSRWCQR